MKKISVIVLIILVLLSFWNCEKDDLCAESTPTTPRVVIEFFNNANPTELKSVTKLVIEETVTNSKLVADASLEETDDTRYLFTANKILLPLRTTVDQSVFNFTLNKGEVNEATDELIFDYTRKEIYISRACGYKTNFEITNPTTIVATLPGSWIQSITVENVIIDNENETHVKIYF
ncbi:MAG: hypothetical protein CMP76_15625 [Flavobacterium sp.]|uniref:DUF6452 family protein n=1 Tax=Flavobacterium sp. TaxID=239 RepID=UPI000C3633C9|nr:DUF6452 family protein [Flavobacterium sp.]MBF04712.1 hypothetical protein [Flavobacterium sp.]